MEACLDGASVVAGLAALAQDTRLAIFRLLVAAGREGLSAGVIAARVGVPPQTLTFHMKSLVVGGLVASTRRSRHIVYAVDFNRVRQLGRYLMSNCCATPQKEIGRDRRRSRLD